MIYTLIADTSNITDTEKRDCQVIRQPLSLLPNEIKKYIDGTNNAEIRAERFFAYSSLFCGLKVFFNIDDCTIRKDENGRPYLVTKDGLEYIKENKKMHISISHSKGVSAVCISDEGEVGIDIQSVIEEEKAARLDKRYFSNIKPTSDKINTAYYFCKVTDDEAMLFTASLPDSTLDSFTDKWVYAETLMKISGRGFGDRAKIIDTAKMCKVQISKYYNDDEYRIAIALKM